MYRSEKWYQQSGGTMDTPICVLSYNRPDNVFFTTPANATIPKSNLFLFIRPTQEQHAMYDQFSDRANIVDLPATVYDIASTRQAIVDWAHDHGYHRIFMVDDTVTHVQYLKPHLSRNNKMSLAPVNKCDNFAGFCVWNQLLNEYHYTLSMPMLKRYSYSAGNIDRPYTYNNKSCFCVVAIDVDDVFAYGLKYLPIAEYGYEDFTFSVEVMKAGLLIGCVTDLHYDHVTSESFSGGTHGTDAGIVFTAEQIVTHNLARNLERTTNVWRHYFGATPFEKLPQARVTVNKNTGWLDMRLNARYWQNVYKSHPAREFITGEVTTSDVFNW